MPDLESLPFTIASLHAAYRAGLSPQEIVEEVARRLARVADPGIFISVAAVAVLKAEAAALGAFDPGKALWGVPVAVKDNIDAAGLTTTAACPDYSCTPERDSEAVARLRSAGALIVGKTNLDQFATGLVGVRTPYAVPVNACDPALVPGGSSSGSAVAVARGIVAVALGTDTAGSGRVPAALNNIVGLKPSLGAVSTAGVVPACRTLDCVSVLALTVEDAWATFAVLAEYDAADPFSRRMPAPLFQPRPPAIRVGVPAKAERIFFGDAASAEAYEAALGQLAALGATIVPIPFADFHAVGALLYKGAWVAERYAAIREMMETRPESIHPVTRKIIGGATALSASQAFEGIYRLKALARKIEPVWADIDLLCVPSIPSPCTLADVEADPIGANARLGTYTNFVNLLDLSAVAVPTGARSDGRPSGVTLIGPAGADGRLAGIARDLHLATTGTLGATGWPLELGTAPEGSPAGRIEVAVLGAHLSGMPLNGQLVGLGGVFCRTARTGADYRLFALSGSPAKPGLLRCRRGEGSAVDTEIWSLSADGFGRFVALIPPPLSIGTLELEDGTAVKGFLVEAEAVKGAADISHFGGWRAYLQSRSALPEVALA